MSQYDKILALYVDKDTACQKEFWQISKSPHKRRKELESTGKYLFRATPCIHGIERSYDYEVIRLGESKPKMEKPKDISTLQRALL